MVELCSLIQPRWSKRATQIVSDHIHLEAHEVQRSVSTSAAEELRKHAPQAEVHVCWQPSSSAPQVAEQRPGSACATPGHTPPHLLQICRFNAHISFPARKHACTAHGCSRDGSHLSFCHLGAQQADLVLAPRHGNSNLLLAVDRGRLLRPALHM